MSSADLRVPHPGAHVYRVGAPHIPGYDSFEEAVLSPATRARESRAKENWRVTDGMIVQSFSYSLTAVRFNYESITLEIFANGPVVDWQLHDLLPPLPEFGGGQSILIYPGLKDEQELFDRNAVLNEMLGKKIRYAPSDTALFVSWKRDYEISFLSLPLADQEGWLLHYGLV